MDNFDPYNVLLAIATNIPVLLMTAFVLHSHIIYNKKQHTHHTHTTQKDSRYNIIQMWRNM